MRLAPVALRLQRQLDQPERRCKLLFADAGATALAKRDAPDQADAITSVSDCYRGELPAESSVLICVTPGPPDYDEVETLCDKFAGPVVLLNGRLEDAAVGIGSVARERRRGFMAQWQSAYTLNPSMPQLCGTPIQVIGRSTGLIPMVIAWPAAKRASRHRKNWMNCSVGLQRLVCVPWTASCAN